VHAQSRRTGERHYDSSRVCESEAARGEVLFGFLASVHKERGAATHTPPTR
jgi:hypothetical protein